MSDKKLATFRIDGEVWEQFQELAKADGSNASKLLIDFVNGYIDRRQSRQSVASDIDSLDICGSNLDTSMDSLDKNQIEQLVVGIVDERTQAIAEKMEALEQRLGEFERLKAKADEDTLRPAPESANDYQQLLAERDRSDERVSDLLLQVENLRDENAVLKQTVIDAGSTEPQPSNRLQEMRDRVLHDLKLGKQAPSFKSAVKALDLFIGLLER